MDAYIIKKAFPELLNENLGITQVTIAEQLRLTRKQVQTTIKELQKDGLLLREAQTAMTAGW